MHDRVLTVGLTGGIASGKSTVSKIFAELGATVVDADAIVHELQAPGTPLLAEIAATFGAGVLDPSGALDRADHARRRLGVDHPKRSWRRRADCTVYGH